jgi:hypothetical protein
MEHILQIDELPTGQFAIMYYEIHMTEKKQKFVITARELDGSVYTFYANPVLEELLKNWENKRSFVFFNERVFRAQIKIVSEKVIL